ncbi:MAG: DUF2207 domain-containing protein [Patescibacteria group bacterium]
MGSTSRRSFGLIILIASFVIAGFAVVVRPAVAQTVEEISSFASDIEVRSDGIVGIVETIEYYFPDERHGIYRDIAEEYVNDRGEQYRIPITVLSVRDERGNDWNYSLERGGSGLRVKIGDPNRTVTGRQVYVIAYEATGALRYFADHDELYWNATGTEWQVPIRRAAATIRLPEPIDPATITLKCYTGGRGSAAENCQKSVQGRQADFAATGALTVVVGWPPGLIAKVEAAAAPAVSWPGVPWRWILSALLPSLVIPLGVFIYLFGRWRRYGRDLQGSPTLVVQYDPPDKLGAAETGVIYDATADIREVSAAIVELAVRGFLLIREVETQGLIFKSQDHELVKLAAPTGAAPLAEHESKLLAALFPAGDTVRLSYIKEHHAFSGQLKGITDSMYDRVTTLGYFEQNPERVRAKYFGAGVAFMLVGFFIAPLAIAAVLAGIICLVFGAIMPKRTARGVQAFDHAKGFREYLEHAEKYRLQWQERENIFEKFLPYAMVFGIVDKWAKAFEGLQLQQPSWYEGRAFGSGAFNAVMFSSAFNSFGTAMNSAVLSTPSRSSSGSGFSGGFSGGGGGGGGGGSW